MGILKRSMHRYICLVILLLLVIPIAGCSPQLGRQNHEHTDGQRDKLVAISPLRADEVELVERRHSISFSGASVGTVKAGNVLNVFFSVANNGSIPIVALKLYFDSTSLFHDFSILPDINSLGGGSALDRPSIRTEGMFVRKDASFESKFGFGVSTPGRYQVLINPHVLAGEWINLGPYVVSFVVEDTVAAVRKRESQRILDSNNHSISRISRAIEEVEGGLRELEGRIWLLDRIIFFAWSEEMYRRSKVERERAQENIRELVSRMSRLVKDREVLAQENSGHVRRINNFYAKMYDSFYR